MAEPAPSSGEHNIPDDGLLHSVSTTAMATTADTTAISDSFSTSSPGTRGVSAAKEQSPAPTTPGRMVLQDLLNRNMKFCLSDGRTVLGTLRCTDKDLNIVLSESVEYGCVDPSAPTGTLGKRRYLGLCLLPGKHIVSASITASVLDNRGVVGNGDEDNAAK